MCSRKGSYSLNTPVWLPFTTWPQTSQSKTLVGDGKIATHWDAWPPWTLHTLGASSLFKGALLVSSMVCVSAAQIRFVPLVNFGLWPGCKQGEEMARLRKGRGGKPDYDFVSLWAIMWLVQQWRLGSATHRPRSSRKANEIKLGILEHLFSFPWIIWWTLLLARGHCTLLDCCS